MNIIGIMDLVKIINKYHKDTGDICLKIIKKYNNVSVYNDTQKDLVRIYSNEIEQPLIVFKHIYAGTYDLDKKIWYWGFNNISLSKEYLKIKEELQDYIKKFVSDTNQHNVKYIEKYHNYITNDMLNLQISEIFDIMRFLVFFFKGKGYIGTTTKKYGCNKSDYYIVHKILVNNIK